MMSNISAEEEAEAEGFPLQVTIPVGIFLAALIILAIVGNILTIMAFFRDSKLRSVYNMYIVNLAITDLFLGCISMPFYAVYTLKNYSWPFGYHFCKAYMVVDFTLCLETVLMMVVISRDRLMLLKHGPHYEHIETQKRGMFILGMTWAVSFLVYSPFIIGWDLWTGEVTYEEGDCDVPFAYDVTFTTVTAVIEFVIPFVTISVLNFLIYLNIRKRKTIHLQKSESNTNASTSTQQPGQATKNSSEQQNQSTTKSQDKERKSDQRSLKAAKFLAALVFVFLLTWAPYTVATLIIAVCETCVNDDLYECLNWLLWTKASLNPFLYAFNSTRFRYNFKRLLWCFRFLYKTENPAIDNTRTVVTID